MVCALCQETLAGGVYHTCNLVGEVAVTLIPMEGPPFVQTVQRKYVEGVRFVRWNERPFEREQTAQGDTLYASLRFFEMEDP
jgi:hypothetical protein